MKQLVQALLNDRDAGLRRDASGRTYFKQRRVTFQTIQFQPRGLLEAGWLDFNDDLKSPFGVHSDPTPAEIREFAALSSDRFLHFYYRVFDVAVARALATLDIHLFQKPFVEGSVFLDLGIPEDSRLSSVHPALHRTILHQYRLSREAAGTLPAALMPGKAPDSPGNGEVEETESINTANAPPVTERAHAGGPRISFLSEYLEGLTDDAIVLLSPYQRLWKREQAIRKIQEQCRSIQRNREPEILGGDRKQFENRLKPDLKRELEQARMQSILRNMESAELRKSLRKFLLNQDHHAFLHLCRQVSAIKSHISPELQARTSLLFLAERLERSVRSALFQDGRLHARLMRFMFLRYRGSPASPGDELNLLRSQRERARREAIQMIQTVSRIRPDVASLETLIVNHSHYRHEIREIYQYFLKGVDRSTGEHEALQNDSPAAADGDREYASKLDERTVLRSAFLRYGGTVEWPPDIAYGNPFARREVLLHTKQQLLDRLRPVRSTTTGYSLVPGSRHGILPLNPVLKLWKEKPGFEASLPPIASLEINTIQTVQCLLLLAKLVHPALKDLQLRLGRILIQKLGTRDLSNMQIFLMPGSCGAAREIERPDFPEFRNTVIGESRKPEELGIASEPAILTGAWYKKRNHALYYPIGGDNGQLIRNIYLAMRLKAPPAFFFALGQFVHDCLPDNLIYYAGSEIPFRQITEDHYRQEDRVRKNRGEKTGRRRIDNSRPAVRFMFAVAYARVLMEALTGSSQSNFRHPPTEKWMSRYLDLPALSVTDRSRIRELRGKARQAIEHFQLSGF